MPRLRHLLALATVLLSGSALPAQEPLRIPRLDESIDLDARLDEEVWERALRLSLDYETQPGENVEPTVRTDCRLFHSASHIYYGCHAFDPEPSAIRARYWDRDKAFPNDDVVGITLDPFNARTETFIFDVNPLGVQNDRSFSETSQRTDLSWDAIWDSAGRLVDDGYVVEAAIPFSSLRFPRTAEEQTWAFNLRRYVPREVFRRIALLPYDRSNPCRLCQTPELVGFAGIDPGHNLEVTPTLTASQTGELDEFPDGRIRTEDPDVEPGITVKWGVTPNLILSGTLNPDFSQVEADVAQLDVNEQFALFFAERRPFFLEGADIFETPVRAVYTRTVADPDWGLKLTGKEGKNALGLFAAADTRTNLLFPGAEGSSFGSLADESTAAVLRYRRDLGKASTIGVLLTGREAGDYSNTVAALDARLRLSKVDTLQFQVLASETEYPLALAESRGQPTGSFGGDALWMQYRRSPRNWTLRANYREYSPEFRADLGFVPQVDFREMEIGGNYRWYGDNEDWYTEIQVGGEVEREETHEGLQLEEEFELFAGFEAQLQSSLFVGGGRTDRVFRGVSFEQDEVWISGNFQPIGDLEVGAELSWSDAIDFREVRPGDERVAAVWVEWQAGRHFTGEGFHIRETLDVEGGRLFTADLSELRTVYQINLRSFVRAIVQFASIERDPSLHSRVVEPRTDDLFGQLLFSYKLDARTALFLGYSGGYLEEADSGLVETGRTFFFKLSYAWQP